jgi:diguanylate cyclase (GGDEF)-like protein
MRAVLSVFCGVVGTATLAYPFASEPVQTVLYLGVSLSAVIAVCWGLHVNRPAVRLPWVLLAAGLTCSLAADSAFEIYQGVAGEVPFPSFIDGLYLLVYPLLFLTLGSFLSALGRPDRTAWVDASVWTIGIGTMLWEPFVEPIVTAGGTTPVGAAVALLYPLLDFGLLLMVLRMMVGRASLHPSYLLLTGALVLQVGIDAAYGIQEAAGTYVSGRALDAGWLLINLLFGATALHPSMGRLTQQSDSVVGRSTHRRLQALLVPALVPAALLIYLHVVSVSYELVDEVVAVGALSVISALIVARGVGLLRISEQRSEQLRDRSTALEEALADRERVAEQLRIRVDQDPLTGLSSRSRFVECVDRAMAAWQLGGPAPSVAFLDLDDFKAINDTLGHEAGDLLLREIGLRMRDHVGDDEVVARLGGDEFAVLLLPSDPEEMATGLVTALQVPFSIEGRLLRPQVSIGMTTAESPRSSTSDLLAEADIAMYAAKRAWFQPVVDLATGRLRGFEALARWTTNGDSAMPSASWLPLAEETGIIIDVDREMLRRAVHQLAAWRRDVPGNTLNMAVNFSGRTLQLPGIEEEILEVLAAANVPTRLLTVEVTEGVLIDDEKVGDRLRRLRAAGVIIGLDDFGTGWSSLNYLRRFPVDHLKLDCSFTQDLGRVSASNTIPSAIVHIARGLSLGLVAEGVETPDQRDRLLQLGFRTGQGYLFGRAQRGSDLAADVLGSVAPPAVHSPALRLAN